MTWIKLDDKFPDHPKVAAAGPMASWLYICGLAYANRLLTDGFLPCAVIRRLADIDDADALAERLVSAALWERVEGGFRIHDYHDYQASRDHVRAVSEARAVAGRVGGKQKSSKLLGAGQRTPQAKLTPDTDTDTDTDSETDQTRVGLSSPAGDGAGDVGPEVVASAPARNGANGKHPRARSPDWPDMAWIDAAYEQSFWPTYPRKTHKQHGLDAWRRLMKRQPSYEAAMALAEHVLEVVGEQSAYWTDPKFTPEAGSYLNGRRWEDEIIIPTGRAARR